jgi:hypothetical protein
MKKKLAALIVLVVILIGIRYFLLSMDVWIKVPAQNFSSSSSEISAASSSDVIHASSSSVGLFEASSSTAVANNAVSGSSSSGRPFSFPRVYPPEQIGHFLKSMDETALPKMQLPLAKRDEFFDYDQATVAELKAKALSGDAFAALRYANYIASRVLRIPNEKGWSRLEDNPQKITAGLAEMREFYVRAMQGGLSEGALALSREYASNYLWGNTEESLAWRKVSFALGESEVYDCVRDSTTCTVKDYNNLLMDSRFSPCVANARDNCSPELYEDATLLAMQYVHSFEFAIHNVPKRLTRR